MSTEALTTGWEPGAPAEDTVTRRFVLAYADRLAAVAARTRGPAEVGRRRAHGRPALAVRLRQRRRRDPTARRGRVAGRARGGAGVLPATAIASDDGQGAYRGPGFIDLFRVTMWEHPAS